MVFDNWQNGIVLQSSSDIVVDSNISTNNTGDGITLTGSQGISIVNNSLYQNHDFGIVAYSSSDIDVWNNFIQDSDTSNLYLTQTVGFNINNNIITISENFTLDQRDILFFENSASGVVFNNNLTSYSTMSQKGIHLLESQYIEIDSNIMKFHSGTGIEFRASQNNKLINNVCEGENQELFTCLEFLGNSNDNQILHNLINLGEDGFRVRDDSQYNVFRNNTLSNLTRGVLLIDDASENLLEDNIFENNVIGFDILTSFNTIRRNLIVESQYYGLFLQEDSYMNDLYYNSFFRNSIDFDHYQLFDEGSYNFFRFNYYDDIDGNNIGGVVDTPYPIYSGDRNAVNYDNFPLAHTYDSEDLYDMFVDLAFLSPDVENKVTGPTTVIWQPAFDTQFGDIIYSLYISSDAGQNWELIKDGVTSNSYKPNFDHFILDVEATIRLKITAYTTSGHSSINAISNKIPYFRVLEVHSTNSNTQATSTVLSVKVNLSIWWIPGCILLSLIRFVKMRNKLSSLKNKYQ